MRRQSSPYRSARPDCAGGLNAIPFQLCGVSTGTYDVLRDRPSRRSGCARAQPPERLTRSAADALIVFTGLSGSGKSSLAFDTIFAEGQRRYVESLSAYARQFSVRWTSPTWTSSKVCRPRSLHRSEINQPQSKVDGRHDHRGLRLPPPALRARRSTCIARSAVSRSAGSRRSRSSTA